ncbi:Protein of unknown function, partial [Cotesia congregata]
SCLLLTLYAPLLTRKTSRPSNPWFTRELKLKCKERDKLYKLAKKYRDQNLLARYRLIRKALKIQLNSAREDYLKTALLSNSPGSSVWSKLKHLGLTNSNSSSPLNFFDPLELNEFYANIVRRHPSCENEFLASLHLESTRQVECSFNWSEIDIVDVTKAVQLTLAKSKGKSPDGLDLRWLKDHLPQAMILGSNGRLRQLQEFDFPPVKINGVVIPYTDSAKCLGVYIDRSLSWNTHVSQVVRKVNSALHCLKVRKNIFTKELRKVLVTATILPLVDYCSAVLVDATAENDRKLQRALNASIVGFIFDLRRDVHISPYRKDLSWLSFKYRRMYFMTCLLYKLLSVGKPNYLRNLFVEEADVRRSDRLAAKKHTSFELPRFTTTYLEHSFLVTVIRVWEELPSDIVNSNSLEVFKNKVFGYFLQLDF